METPYIKGSWQSYPSSFNLGHRAVRDLLLFPHVIEEKVDGSQFSFGRFKINAIDAGSGNPVDAGEELRVRSKGAVMNIDAPEKLFAKAVEEVKRLAPLLQLGWTYRAEYLAKPSHNTLKYDRVPLGNIIIFDVSTGDQEWLSPTEKAVEAGRLGLECVPVLDLDLKGGATTLERLRLLLDNTQSCLGGQLIEGVVVKPIAPLYGPDGKTLMGKFVSERFKESHRVTWGENNPSGLDVVGKIIAAHRTPARYHKAVQHLRDAGVLTESPRDIGKLLIEVEKDLGKEEKESIQLALWKHFWPQIARGVKAGVPQFYKEELLRLQFEREGAQEFLHGEEVNEREGVGDGSSSDQSVVVI